MSAQQNLAELKNDIFFELINVDVKPYSHNIVGLLLSQLEKKFGEKEFIQCLKDYRGLFEKKGWKHLFEEYKIENQN